MKRTSRKVWIVCAEGFESSVPVRAFDNERDAREFEASWKPTSRILDYTHNRIHMVDLIERRED